MYQNMKKQTKMNFALKNRALERKECHLGALNKDRVK